MRNGFFFFFLCNWKKFVKTRKKNLMNWKFKDLIVDLIWSIQRWVQIEIGSNRKFSKNDSLQNCIARVLITNFNLTKMSKVTDSHRLLLQCIVSRKVVEEEELVTLFGRILDEYKVAKPRDLKSNNFDLFVVICYLRFDI